MKLLLSKETRIIVIVFLVSRIVASCFDLHLNYIAIDRYWQYLNVDTLRHNLLRGVWYDHAQPPVFNLFLGLVLKVTGQAAPIVFSLIFKLITLFNAFLLFNILRRTVTHLSLPLYVSLFYLLSPAALIFENELFYTTFISLFFLVSCYALLGILKKIKWKNSSLFFFSLIIICLTRSMYHLVFLLVIVFIILFSLRKKKGFYRLVPAALISLLVTGGWYLKNYLIFGVFSTSSWVGMNMARNVFHDSEISDSTRIESIVPFSRIDTYAPFLSQNLENKYQGLNDKDLLSIMKRDSFLNEHHIAYIEVSKLYMQASKEYIRRHPRTYLKNAVQSAIIFFAPATRYSLMEAESRKIKYYDLVYSFNLSHFAKGKQQRRIAMAVSAFPKILLYLLTFYIVTRDFIRKRKIPLLQLYIIIIIAYVFTLSSLLEHYENMRFRFEIEPLFLILAAMAISRLLRKKIKTPVAPDLSKQIPS